MMQRAAAFLLLLLSFPACDPAKTHPPESGPTTASTAAPAGTPSSSTAIASSAPSSAPPPSPSSASGLPPVASGSHAETSQEQGWETWVRKRVTSAKADRREIVRIPIGASWGGSTTPDVFVGSWEGGGHVLGGQDGLSVEWGPGTVEASGPRSVIAEGWFTGAQTAKATGPGTYDQFAFHVMRSRVPAAAKDLDEKGDPHLEVAAERVEVLLSAPESLRELPQLNDDRPWFVVVASRPLLEADVDEHAENTRADLVAHGFEGAVVIDSRQATGMFCCFRIVLAGRFATSGAAQAALAKAKGIYPAAFVRKGF